MWGTGDDSRILGKAEVELIGQATWSLIDWIRDYISVPDDDESQTDTGILLFDQMSPAQQLVMLDKVFGLMVDPNLEPPSPSALLDSTVAAIYIQIHWNIESEIDLEKDLMDFPKIEKCDSFRNLVTNALNECPSWHDEPYPNCPAPDCDDMDEWEQAISSLRDRFLADEDWAMNDLVLDLPPEENSELKQSMGIQDNYYLDIPPIVTDEDAHRAWKNIVERVTGSRPVDDDGFDDSVPF